MNQPRILLIDLRQESEDPDTLCSLGDRCIVERVAGNADIGAAISSLALHALCFEYDYPDITSLMLLKETKLAHPSLPIFMITRQHSESLAVWALRNGVWDYFVKPVPASELRNCMDSLAQLPLRSASDMQRKMMIRSCALPNETRFRHSNSPADKNGLDRAIEYVERNLAQKISQTAVARVCNLSTWQFSRQFKKYFGTTFQEYVQHQRIMQAVKLLKHPSASVTDVCFSTGFVDPSYFSRVFRRYVGMSPSCYKEQLQDVNKALATAPKPVTAR